MLLNIIFIRYFIDMVFLDLPKVESFEKLQKILNKLFID